jgi:transposase
MLAKRIGPHEMTFDGFSAPADYNAALNIRGRAAVNQPYAGIVEGEAGSLS